MFLRNFVPFPSCCSVGPCLQGCKNCLRPTFWWNCRSNVRRLEALSSSQDAQCRGFFPNPQARPVWISMLEISLKNHHRGPCQAWLPFRFRQHCHYAVSVTRDLSVRRCGLCLAEAWMLCFMHASGSSWSYERMNWLCCDLEKGFRWLGSSSNHSTDFHGLYERSVELRSRFWMCLSSAFLGSHCQASRWTWQFRLMKLKVTHAGKEGHRCLPSVQVLRTSSLIWTQLGEITSCELYWRERCAL